MRGIGPFRQDSKSSAEESVHACLIEELIA